MGLQVPRSASSGYLQVLRRSANQMKAQVPNTLTRIEVTLQPMGVQVPRFTSSGYLHDLKEVPAK